MISNTQNEQRVLKIYARSARSMMEDFPFLSITGYRSINLYSCISPVSCIYKYMSQSMDRRIRSTKTEGFFLPFFIHNISKDTAQQFTAIFIPYVVCVCVYIVSLQE